MKYVYFKNNIPYCNYTKDGINLELKLNSIHFVVWSKIYMKRASKTKNLDFNPVFINIFREYTVFREKLARFAGEIRHFLAK